MGFKGLRNHQLAGGRTAIFQYGHPSQSFASAGIRWRTNETNLDADSGYLLHRSGSIIGISCTWEIITVTVAGNAHVRAFVGPTTPSLALATPTVNIAAPGPFQVRGTAAPGIWPFSAGDLLIGNSIVDGSGNLTTTGGGLFAGMIEVMWDD